MSSALRARPGAGCDNLFRLNLTRILGFASGTWRRRGWVRFTVPISTSPGQIQSAVDSSTRSIAFSRALSANGGIALPIMGLLD